uniref:ribosomal protein S13 n=1 Tax=Cocconeiopsis kantsiensis TaxID=3082010 RepID=UPI003001D988
MIYIFEYELFEQHSVFFALNSIYGIGTSRSNVIIKKSGFSKNLKVNEMSKQQINKLVKVISVLDFKLGSDLKKQQIFNLNDAVEIKSYRGLRKLKGFPVRGQRTHTNAKTSKKRFSVKN